MNHLFVSLSFRLFSATFWKAFLPLSTVSILLFSLEYRWYSTFDPAYNPSYVLMCLIAIISWSSCISLSICVLGLMRTLPIACVALLFIAMDYFNYGTCRKEDYYTTVYHAMSIASLFSILNLLAYFIPCRIISFFRTFFFFLFFLFPIAIIGNKILSGNGLNGDAMVAIQQTDIREAYHYFFGLNNGLLLLIWLFFFISVTYVVYRFAISCSKTRTTRQKILCGGALFYCSIAILPCFSIGFLGNMYKYFTPHIYDTMKYPITYSLALKDYSKYREDHLKVIQERLAEIDNWDCFSGKYIVVIGESLNKNFMGCYGYSKNTTPFQSKLKDDDKFFLFKHCFACYVQTQRVLRLLLTNLNQYNGKGFEISDAVSCLDIANLYNYQTEWLSGQERISNSNSVITALADSADQIYFSKEKMQNRDLDLVQQLGKSTILSKDRSLAFLHLNGSHYPYHLSFPAELCPDALDFSVYEKSVYYNDIVMSRLYDLAKTNNVDVLLYVSDHSDGVSAGKGHDSRNYLQEMVEIPLWIYISDAYKKEHPDIADQLRIATNQVFTNDLVFDLLLYLMGIDNEFVDKTLVPGSDDYRINEDTARTLYGEQRLFIK